MKTDNLTIFGLFERQIRYVVPLFQRPYVWTKDKQWEAMWEDISVKAERVLNKGTNHPDINRHFLGALVLNSERPEGYQVPIKLVVDGQQRITTMQIIMIAFRDFAKACNENNIVNNLDLLTTNRIGNILEEEKLKVWPTNADQNIFNNIYKARSINEVRTKFPLYYPIGSKKPEPRPILVEAYIYFYERIQEFVTSSEENGIDNNGAITDQASKRLMAIYDAFLQLMEVVTIDLDEKDNPQVIFESLNYLGEPLLPSDLIRNFVFLEANRRGESVEELYEQYWYDYDRPGKRNQYGFWKVEEKQGRLKYPRLDLFVFHYLSFLEGEELLITRIYKEFQSWWKKTPNRCVKAELILLKEFSEIFTRFFKPESDTRMDLFLDRLRLLDMSTVYPLLLYLLSEKDQLSQDELDRVAVDLESYLIRRLVCGLTGKNYNKFFLGILNRLRNSTEVNRKQLQKLLLEPEGDTGRWPKDDEFRKKWLSQPIYRTTRSRIPLLLMALEQQMLTNKQEQVTVSGKLTVEHILPQKYKIKDYPFPAGTGLDETGLRLQRDDLLHTIGNLTLLTSALNSQVSNGPFKDKKPEIAKQSSLRLNTYFQNQKLGNRWNEINIQDRGEYLFEIALKVWPRPEAKLT
jgi:uncharacterized protein with ParB-like and HNH nuclease domain